MDLLRGGGTARAAECAGTTRRAEAPSLSRRRRLFINLILGRADEKKTYDSSVLSFFFDLSFGRPRVRAREYKIRMYFTLNDSTPRSQSLLENAVQRDRQLRLAVRMDEKENK